MVADCLVFWSVLYSRLSYINSNFSNYPKNLQYAVTIIFNNFQVGSDEDASDDDTNGEPAKYDTLVKCFQHWMMSTNHHSENTRKIYVYSIRRFLKFW